MSTRRPPSNHEPDDLAAPVPEPGDEPTAAERASARAFGDLIDKSLAGRTPPAMAAADRELLDVATIIRSVANPAELPASRVSSLVDGALRQAVGDRPASSISDLGNPEGVIPLAARRRSNKLPWALTAVSTTIAAAAVAMLVITSRPADHVTAPPPAATADVPDHWRSRPTDELIGAIAPEDAADAGSRIDAIYADRLNGFRERTLAGRRSSRGGSTP